VSGKEAQDAKESEMANKYAVVPGPGMYGQKGHVVSRHKTPEAAIKAAERATKKYRETMQHHGGTSGSYYACEIEDDWFWSDCAPKALK